MFGYRYLKSIFICLFSLSVSANSDGAYKLGIIRLDKNWQDVHEIIQENSGVVKEPFRQILKMASLPDEYLKQLEQNGLDLEKLISINNRLEQALNLLRNAYSNDKDISIESIDVKPSICSSASFVEVYALKIIKTIALEVLSAAKWECRQEISGSNSALVCLAAAELAQFAKASVEVSSVCLLAKRKAREDAMLGTIHNITEHINKNLGSAVSTRTSKDQVTVVFNDSKLVNQKLDDTLPIRLPNIQSSLDDLLQTLSENEQKLLDIQTRTTDLVQRQQLNNAQSDDIDQRIADLSLLMSEIRLDTQNIKQTVLSINNSLQQPNYQQLDTDHMAWAMSQQLGKNIVAYQLPNSYGGQLEKIRELVALSISNAALAGMANNQAQSYFYKGDDAYNVGNYASAYSNYAKAFRVLGTINVNNAGGQ